MLVVRKQQVLSAEEAGIIREGDHVYLLAPPQRAQALDRFFVDMPPPSEPGLRQLGDFYVLGTATVASLAEIYGVPIDDAEKADTVSDVFARRLGGDTRKGSVLQVGPIALVAMTVSEGRVTQAGLRLADPDPVPLTPPRLGWFKRVTRRLFGWPPRRRRG